MSGDTTTYSTPPCIILVCSIQFWRSSNSAPSYMSMKTSPSSDMAGDGDSEGGGGDPTGSSMSRPNGISVPTTGTPGFSATGGDSGDSSAKPAKIIFPCWFSILQSTTIRRWNYEPPDLIPTPILYDILLSFATPVLRIFESWPP